MWFCKGVSGLRNFGVVSVRRVVYNVIFYSAFDFEYNSFLPSDPIHTGLSRFSKLLVTSRKNRLGEEMSWLNVKGRVLTLTKLEMPCYSEF